MSDDNDDTVRPPDRLAGLAGMDLVRRTLEATERLHQDDGIEAEVIDLLTISPLDDKRFIESARKTGRVVIVHEAPQTFGPGGEMVARLVEQAFLHLEAPIKRVNGYDIIVPYFAREQAYIPDAERIVRGAREVLRF